MDWQAIGAIGDILAGLGTVFGLAFVVYELRNLRRQQYASSSQNIADSERDIWAIALQDEQMVQLAGHHLGFTDEFLEKQGISRKHCLQMLLFFRQYENLYYQHKHGMLPPDLWFHWHESMIYTFSDKTIQEILFQSKASYTIGFREFIRDEVIAKTTPLSN